MIFFEVENKLVPELLCAEQVIQRRELCFGERIRVQHRVELINRGLPVRVRVLVRHLIEIPVILLQHVRIDENELRAAVIQRVGDRPVRRGQRVAVPADVVRRDARLLVDLHGIDAVDHMRAPRKQHVHMSLCRLVEERRVLIDTLLALHKAHDAPECRKEQAQESDALKDPYGRMFY